MNRKMIMRPSAHHLHQDTKITHTTDLPPNLPIAFSCLRTQIKQTFLSQKKSKRANHPKRDILSRLTTCTSDNLLISSPKPHPRPTQTPPRQSIDPPYPASFDVLLLWVLATKKNGCVRSPKMQQTMLFRTLEKKADQCTQ